MLAIISSFAHWRHYLEGARHTVTVYTDHKNLEVFMSTKILNRRQPRWAELLAGYDFVLTPIPGSKNPADGPSRRPDYAEDVEMPNGPLFPSSALRNLPNGATLSRLSASLAVFTPESSLRQRLLDAYLNDPVAIAQREPTAPYEWRNRLLLHNSLIYVPRTLRLDVLKLHHDDPLAGHFSIAKTLELLSRNY